MHCLQMICIQVTAYVLLRRCVANPVAANGGAGGMKTLEMTGAAAAEPQADPAAATVGAYDAND